MNADKPLAEKIQQAVQAIHEADGFSFCLRF